MKLYRCPKCGNMVAMIEEHTCIPHCCGEPMKELTANTTDGAREKHVPFVEVDDNKVKVRVGEVDHPMLEAHYITWIALESEMGWQIKYLKPGEEPKRCFHVCHKDKPIAVYEYCNLHGLWKKEL